MISAPVLAKEFAARLRDEIGVEKFREAKRLNATPEYGAGICASHDFCDANMTMARAFYDVVGRDPDMDSDADIDLWNRAWSIAKRRHLTHRDRSNHARH